MEPRGIGRDRMSCCPTAVQATVNVYSGSVAMYVCVCACGNMCVCVCVCVCAYKDKGYKKNSNYLHWLYLAFSDKAHYVEKYYK